MTEEDIQKALELALDLIGRWETKHATFVRHGAEPMPEPATVAVARAYAELAREVTELQNQLTAANEAAQFYNHKAADVTVLRNAAEAQATQQAASYRNHYKFTPLRQKR